MAAMTSIGFGTDVALADDPYGKHTEHPENAMYSIQVYDFPYDDYLISGTNVHFRVEAAFQVIGNPDGGGGTAGNPVKKIIITDMKAKIQDTEIPNPSPIDNSQTSHHFDVVFASTHFPHDTQLTIKGIASFHLIYQDNSSSDQTIEVAVKPRTYNKGALLATSVDSGDGEAATALACVNAIGPILEAMSHVVLPKPFSGAQRLDEGLLDARLIDATVFFACTHGEPGAFWDSASQKKYDRTKVHAVLARRPTGRPGYNLVFLAGCQTALGTQGDELANEFGMNVYSVDKAFVGFKATLLAPGLNQFCQSVFSKLNEGYEVEPAIQAALKITNPQAPGVLPGTTTKLRPVILGDKATRLINVYKGAFTWYLAF